MASFTPLQDARDDPYYVVRNNAATKIDLARLKHGEFLNGLETSNVATDRGLKGLRRALVRDVRKCNSELKDLELSLQMVEGNRAGFDHIDDRELETRRAFISESRTLLRDIHNDVDGPAYKARLADDEAKAAASIQSGDTLGAKTRAERANTDYINQQRAVTQIRMNEQEDTLVELGQGVDRVGRMATTIHEELGEQNRMLDNFETDMDRAEEEMGLMLGKIAKLLKTRDYCQIWTVIGLTAVIVVLCFVLIYG
mmetsp:Transcript_45114/g.141331  ORF Transcript_45114/g.141331 Transcript_45114/m.141331 type:complete len:255 (-) Transcript_45114:3119-3883(-)